VLISSSQVGTPHLSQVLVLISFPQVGTPHLSQVLVLTVMESWLSGGFEEGNERSKSGEIRER